MDVLIVEDETPLRESLVDGLSKAFSDLSVSGAESAEQAEALLASEAPKLIISDVRLPGKDGVELLLDVRGRRPNTRFVFMSAYPSPEAREQAQERGIRFLCKPFEFDELIDAVERVLDENEFSGELGGISLVDLLQVLNMGRRTAAVTLRRRGEAGRIFLSEGEIVHAVVGDLGGRKAFDRLMAWKGGSFGSEPGCEPPATTITESFNALLLDCFRIQDEGTEEADSDEFVEGLVADGSASEGANASPRALLEEALRTISGCVSAGCVDIATGTLLDLTPTGAVPEPIADLIPATTKVFFEHPALCDLDAILAGGTRAPAPGESTIREVIVLSGEMAHHFQRAGVRHEHVFVTVCRATKNLGTVVAKARACLGKQTRSGSRA